MFKKRRIAIAASLIIMGVIMGLIISSNFNLFTKGYTEETKISKDAIDLLTKINEATAEVAAAARPAVVNISSTKTIHMRGMASPFSDDPFFRQFFGDQFRQFEKPRDYKQSGLGSGVIVDKNGYILTNNHVIKDADDIKVRLSDKKVFKGKIVGADPKTDLAVIKIDAVNLPVISLGDSDKLQVGDRVIAVGNPFGLNQTVTTGIISAKGRADVGIADYEDFIQTDAPINPGNSGGALVNVKGELIGINTAILSSSGGNQGIGLAIPSNMAKTVMASLIKKGKVVRGWLGVAIQPITPDLAKQLGLKEEKGALVADIMEGSPAEKSGMQRGDVITEFDGKPVIDSTELKNLVANTSPGKEVTVKYIRDGNLKMVKVSIQELPVQAQIAAKYENQLKGVSVQNLTPEIRKELGLPNRATGVVISDVDETSQVSGVLAPGDVIMEINKRKISSVKDYEAVVAKIKSGQNILVLIYRNGSTIYITL
jgi:serine protease Do